MRENELFFAKTKPNAIIPTKRKEDAAYDVYACATETIVIPPCSTQMIDIGIAMACHESYFIKFFDKGGMGSKGIVVGAGVGDSGYRNSYFVPLINTNYDKYLVISSQTPEEVAKSEYFGVKVKKFASTSELAYSQGDYSLCISKDGCIIKFLNKAIAQFVVLPVPDLKTKEISWEELQEIESERGMGNLGSTGK